MAMVMEVGVDDPNGGEPAGKKQNSFCLYMSLIRDSILG